MGLKSAGIPGRAVLLGVTLSADGAPALIFTRLQARTRKRKNFRCAYTSEAAPRLADLMIDIAPVLFYHSRQRRRLPKDLVGLDFSHATV